MRRWMSVVSVVVLVVCGAVLAGEAEPQIYPAAILTFAERGTEVRGYGAKVSDLLFASLVADPNLMLVDRAELEKVLQEHELNLSGVVRPDQATQVGQLTGAKILICGSVIEVGNTLVLVAKLIGTETSRVLGQSVRGKMSDDLAELVDQLAKKVSELITKRSDVLVAKPVKVEDRIASLKAKLGEAKLPTLFIKISEHHIGQATYDPAGQTEMTLFARGVGFEVIDPEKGSEKQADIVIKGEAFSEFGMRRGNLISVKARVEVKAIDRATDKVIAVDRQSAVTVDLTEQLAGKKAIQEASAQIAERLFPKLVKK